jgi:hypothetical protein
VFKGFEDYVVQELVFRKHVVRYRRERWLTPDGREVVAETPAGVSLRLPQYSTRQSTPYSMTRNECVDPTARFPPIYSKTNLLLFHLFSGVT